MTTMAHETTRTTEAGAAPVALTEDGAQLRYFLSEDHLYETTDVLVLVNDKHLLHFFGVGEGTFSFTLTTWPDPAGLAAALEYRYEAATTSREEAEKAIEAMRGTSLRTYRTDLRLALHELVGRGFTS